MHYSIGGSYYWSFPKLIENFNDMQLLFITGAIKKKI